MKQFVGETCEIVCVDNNRKSTADILYFQEKKHITVSLQKSVKLELHWNGKTYEGKMSGLTFTSYGPSIKQIKSFR